MSKKLNKKKPKYEDTEDDTGVDNDTEDNYDDYIVEDDDSDGDYDDYDEKDDFIIDPDAENSGCVIDDVINDDDEYFNNVEETELPSEQGMEYVSKENRISSNRLSKYEMVRILGERIKQLTLGAKPLIKNFQTLSYDSIAEEELKRNMIPFKIKRPLPNGKYEIWTLDELYKDHLLSQFE
jgi:DNA-directed RNA polymerase subunit K/omega